MKLARIGMPGVDRRDDVTAARRDTHVRRTALAAGLRRVASLVVRNLTQRPVTGVVVILLTNEAPEVGWQGVDHEDLRAASQALSDARGAQRMGRDTHAAVENGWRRRQQHEADRLVSKAQDAAERPWMCEHHRCERRFKTERGANQHERQCRRRPTNPTY